MGTQTGYLSGTMLGRFRIGSLLGRGGMGEVYRAEDAELGRSVALKVLPESLLGDEDRLARFTQEARTASALNHSHIVAIYDVGGQVAGGGRDAARPVQYVAMELVAGASMREVTNGLVDYRVGHVTADGRSMLAVGFDAAITIWTAPLGNPAALQRLPSLIGDGRFGIAWTGDGQRIFFGGLSRDRRLISSIAADGSDRRELAVDGQSLWPCPAPDGSFIAFFGTHGGQFAIWRARPDGGDVRLLAAVSDSTYLTLSPDGRWLYYSSSASGTASTWRVPSDGSAKPTLVVPGLERAAVSPDGTLLAGVYVAAPLAPQTLAVVPAGGGQPITQFAQFAVATGAGSIAWDNDGRSVLYTSVERANVWRQPLSGEAPQKITAYSDLTIFRFALSRGGRLALGRGTQTRDAVLITNFR